MTHEAEIEAQRNDVSPPTVCRSLFVPLYDSRTYSSYLIKAFESSQTGTAMFPLRGSTHQKFKEADMRHWGKTRNTLLALIAVSMMTSGCSVVMAASRSSYRGDVAVIKEGAPRTEVLAELGQPDSFSKTETGGFDDRYVLDPDAHRTWVKVATAIGHLGADFFTLCLWEFVGTPYEIAVRDKVVTYHLQYSPQGTLTSIEKIKG